MGCVVPTRFLSLASRSSSPVTEFGKLQALEGTASHGSALMHVHVEPRGFLVPETACSRCLWYSFAHGTFDRGLGLLALVGTSRTASSQPPLTVLMVMRDPHAPGHVAPVSGFWDWAHIWLSSPSTLLARQVRTRECATSTK